MNKVTSFINKKLGMTGLKLRKASPDILVIAGAAGTVAAVVLACLATRKVDEVEEERKELLDKVDQSSETAKNDILKVNAQAAVKYVRLYAPTGIVLGTSLGMIFKSHGILKTRNAALGAAYFAVDQAFKKYRERVIEQFGEETDKILKYGIKEEEVEIKSEDGGEMETAKVKTADISPQYSCYAKVFDESSRQWEKNAEYNYMFLRKAQEHFNDLLNIKGHLFLNEVYDYLDIPRTQAGAIVGWLKDGDDGKVDIGLYNVDSERGRAFINGYERNIILDFNVDGVIFDKI